IEIEFDLAAMRIVEEQLPEAAAHTLEREPAQLVCDAGLFELRGGGREVGRGKGHVVDDPGAHLVELLPVDHMQDRLVADIEPIAGELKIGSMSATDRKSTRLTPVTVRSRMPSSA